MPVKLLTQCQPKKRGRLNFNIRFYFPPQEKSEHSTVELLKCFSMDHGKKKRNVTVGKNVNTEEDPESAQQCQKQLLMAASTVIIHLGVRTVIRDCTCMCMC